jgi:hypothetical protein
MSIRSGDADPGPTRKTADVVGAMVVLRGAGHAERLLVYRQLGAFGHILLPVSSIPASWCHYSEGKAHSLPPKHKLSMQ